LLAGLNGDFVAGVEQHQRPVCCVEFLDNIRPVRAFSHHTLRGRRIPERARAFKDVRERVASELDGNGLSLAWRNPDVR
jgi:hypothetical protein